MSECLEILSCNARKGCYRILRNVIVQRRDYYPFYSDKSLQEEGRTKENSCKSSDLRKCIVLTVICKLFMDFELYDAVNFLFLCDAD